MHLLKNIFRDMLVAAGTVWIFQGHGGGPAFTFEAGNLLGSSFAHIFYACARANQGGQRLLEGFFRLG